MLGKRQTIFLAMGAMVAGCGTVFSSRPYEPRRDWPLGPARPVMAGADPRGAVLEVRTMQAGPGVEGRGVQTREEDGSEQTAFYEQFLVPPADALGGALNEWLAASGKFAAVISSGSRAEAGYALETQLNEIYAQPGHGEAVVVIGMTLLDVSGTRSRVVLQRSVTGRAKLAASDAPAEVAAINAAAASAFSEIENAVAGAILL